MTVLQEGGVGIAEAVAALTVLWAVVVTLSGVTNPVATGAALEAVLEARAARLVPVTDTIPTHLGCSNSWSISSSCNATATAHC